MSGQSHSPLPCAKHQRDRSSAWLRCAASLVLLAPPVLLERATRTVVPGPDAFGRGRWNFPEHNLRPTCYLEQSEGMCHEVLAPCECVPLTVHRSGHSWHLRSAAVVGDTAPTQQTCWQRHTERGANPFDTRLPPP